MAQTTSAPASSVPDSLPGESGAQDAGVRVPAGGAAHAERAARWLLDALGLELSGDLLALALTHRSYAYENGGLPTNERLEFLGDSVLGLVVTDELYRSHPDLPEGQLAKLRASVVNMTSLARVSRSLGEGGIGPHLLLGRGEQATGGREKDSILADALEALIGAVHLGQGLDTAATVVHRLFDPLLAESATRGAGLDWKTSLQELGASRGLGAPVYEVEDEGPDHAKTFTAAVLLAGEVRGSGAGKTKKAAEQEAAETAWRALSADGGPTRD
ncbi:ribonuclease III [Modestobacter sp. VKM Ac-2977]|uniref:ribonuclease III n=1 Tax=Modestobacter sp. VKM Ac-2977 TaxID=3004131 RepID=UPI0022AA0790|nr:ribonuclease III [Modestobacter sp. VKM Ac-2977]MCZ2822045.1 ribonuclease III [Modestobacter sp. VKM Ac-2977]